MKKIISFALAVVLITACMSINAFADNSATVFVSIADKGRLVVAMEEVTVTDIDNDGVLTVNDALYAAHESAFPDGASKGYGYYNHKDYGLSLGKLWGDSSGNFGYYLNNKSCWSLADTVKSGDCLNAFVYSDSKYFSDKYCYFSASEISADMNSDIVLTLNSAGYDENWNPVTVPVAGAEITVDGLSTGIKTDSEGKATIKISSSGTHIISATSSSTIVPPVCKAEVSDGFFASVISYISSFFEAIINFILSFFE